MQLPLEPQTSSRKLFPHMQCYSPTPVNRLWCIVAPPLTLLIWAGGQTGSHCVENSRLTVSIMTSPGRMSELEIWGGYLGTGQSPQWFCVVCVWWESTDRDLHLAASAWMKDCSRSQWGCRFFFKSSHFCNFVCELISHLLFVCTHTLHFSVTVVGAQQSCVADSNLCQLPRTPVECRMSASSFRPFYPPCSDTTHTTMWVIKAGKWEF